MEGIAYDQMDSSKDMHQIASSAQELALLAELERRKEARLLAIPTDDTKVRLMLREIEEPVTLFGEGPYERRERLRQLVSKLDVDVRRLVREVEIKLGKEEGMESDVEDDEQEEEFYTEGTESLMEARRLICAFSLPRTRHRLARQRIESDVPFTESKPRRKQLYQSLQTFGLYGTQIGGQRPMSSCRFSPDGRMLITGDFGGEMNLWSVPDCRKLKAFRGHHERLGGISWHPQACRSQSSSSLNLASGDNEGKIYLWSLESDEPIAELEGHALRVANTAFHPTGRYLGSAGYDYSWRLWDLEQGEEILLQEGHSRPVHAIDFQHDGALVVTGGIDGLGRVWDLRTGRSIMILQGHVNTVTATAFSPSSYEIATASSDNSVRIHDVRHLKNNIYMIPAHTNVVSAVRFHFQYEQQRNRRSPSPNKRSPRRDQDMVDVDETNTSSPLLASYYGDFLVTGGFDGVAKIWGSGDWRPLRTLAGHEGKVMDVDVSPDGSTIASASFDRTFKLWTTDGGL